MCWDLKSNRRNPKIWPVPFASGSCRLQRAADPFDCLLCPAAALPWLIHFLSCLPNLPLACHSAACTSCCCYLQVTWQDSSRMLIVDLCKGKQDDVGICSSVTPLQSFSTSPWTYPELNNLLLCPSTCCPGVSLSLLLGLLVIFTAFLTSASSLLLGYLLEEYSSMRLLVPECTCAFFCHCLRSSPGFLVLILLWLSLNTVLSEV